MMDIEELVARYHAAWIRDDITMAQALEAALTELAAGYEEQLEVERMRLAACGVIAMSNTAESAAEARQMLPEYWSASAKDCANAVDREMALRERIRQLSETHAIEMRAYEATVQNQAERIRQLEAEELAHEYTLSQRDRAEDAADELAKAIAEHFRVDIGEHSNANDPWKEALCVISGEYVTDSDVDRQLAESEKRIRQLEANQVIYSPLAAIQFAIEQGAECLTFLRLWNEGEFAAIRREWPECPEEVFIGADPLATQQKKEWE